jgi:4-amino-4-deoxy-L-arabinose transferase-like glycosyltransferase
VFFSISKGKRPQYILSIYPAFALLIGYLGDRAVQCWQDRYYRKAIIIPSLVHLVLLALLVVALPIAAGIYFKPWLGVTFGFSAIAGIFTILLWLAWRKKQVQQLLLLPAGLMLVILIYCVHFPIPKLNEYKSPRPFCDEIVKRVDKGADWAMYRFYRATYVYYTDSFAKVLNTEDELNRFLDQPNQTIVALQESRYHNLNTNLKHKSYVIYKKQIGSKPMVLISNQKE